MTDKIINKQIFSFTGTESKKEIQNFIKKNGFLLVKNCFDQNQLEEFKKFFESPENKIKFIESPPAKIIPGASHVVKGFEKLITAPNLIEILNKIIDGKIAYTSHSDLHSGLSTGWHKDDGGGLYFQGYSDFYTNDDCSVYRVGIYLRDCTNEGGLSVKVGSHDTPNRDVGDELYIPSKLGDAVIFDVRITHKGWTKNRNLFSEIVNKIYRKFKKNTKRDKLPFEKKSIFLAYGALNKFTEIYSIKNMEKQNKFYDEDISSMPKSLEKSLKENNIHYFF